MTHCYNILEMEAALKNATSIVLRNPREQFQDHLSSLADSGLTKAELGKNTHAINGNTPRLPAERHFRSHTMGRA
jgi:hypothetical protein